MKKLLILLLVLLSSLSISNAMDLLWSHPVPGGISCFKYSDDGKFYYTVGGDGYLRKWDAPTGTQVEEKKIPIDTPFAAVDVSSDGNNVAVFRLPQGYNRHDFYLWNTSEDSAKTVDSKTSKDYYDERNGTFALTGIYYPYVAVLKNNKTLFLGFTLNFLHHIHGVGSHRNQLTYKYGILELKPK